MASSEDTLWEDDVLKIFNNSAADIVAIDLNEEKAESWKPKTKKTIGYIVGSVLVKDGGREVLMIQEAKLSCRGTWYLPIGRLEPGETLVTGAKREAKEEAGVDMEVTSLVCVEASSGWWRFTFTGDIVGGHPKTKKEADSESMQAGWYPLPFSDLKLRASDILPMIDVTLRRAQGTPAVMPVEHPHTAVLVRLLVVSHTDSQVKVLLSLTRRPHLPVLGLVAQHTFSSQIDDMLKASLGDKWRDTASVHHCGLAGLEFNGVPKHVHDGLCATLVCRVASLSAPRDIPRAADGYAWTAVCNPEINTTLLQKMSNNAFIPFTFLD